MLERDNLLDLRQYTITVIKVKDGGGLAQDDDSGNRQKWTHSEYVLEVTTAHLFIDWIWEDNIQIFSLSCWIDGTPDVACQVCNASVDMTNKQLALVQS